MKVNLGNGYTAVWNGSHTVNYYDSEGRNYDCMTFGYDSSCRPTQLEALSAIIRRDADE